MTARAQPLGTSLTHEVDVNGRHVIRTDEPVSLCGRDTAPAPHELLPAALAACASTMIALYASRHGWPIEGLAVEVDYEPDAVPRRFDVRLKLPPGLSSEQVRRLQRVADSCPVKRALQAPCAVEDHVVRAAGAPDRDAA
jgi:putative redox protein